MLLSDYVTSYESLSDLEKQGPLLPKGLKSLDNMALMIAKDRGYECGRCGTSIFEEPLYLDAWLDRYPPKDLLEEGDEEELEHEENRLLVHPQDCRVRCRECSFTMLPGLEVGFPEDRPDCISLINEHPKAYDPEKYREDDPDLDELHPADREEGPWADYGDALRDE